jgi:hypothetical protein
METIVSVSKTVMGRQGPSRVRIPPPPLTVANDLLRRHFDPGVASERMRSPASS